MELNFFALRHVATQQYMPEFENGRGYSHWTPVGPVKDGISTVGGDGALAGSVRLFPSMQGANNARVAWARGIHEREYHRSHDPLGGVDDYERVTPRDVGRSKEDLEIVPMMLTPSERAVLHIKFSQQECVDMMRKAFERCLAEYAEDGVALRRLKGLTRLCGYVQDSSDEPVTFAQDDATNTFHVSVGRNSVRSYSGNSLGEALDAAIAAEVKEGE